MSRPTASVLCAMLAASALSLAHADPASSPAVTPPGPPPASLSETVLTLARSEGEILVSWTQPAVRLKGIDIIRNTSPTTQGRKRLAFVRPDRGVFHDKVPDPSAQYWYWLKLVPAEGKPVNIGPVATPPAQVWSPAP